MTRGRGRRYAGAMPETNPPPLPPLDLDEAERLLLEAAVREARESDEPDVPHEVVRVELLEEAARLRQLIRDKTGL